MCTLQHPHFVDHQSNSLNRCSSPREAQAIVCRDPWKLHSTCGYDEEDTTIFHACRLDPGYHSIDQKLTLSLAARREDVNPLAGSTVLSAFGTLFKEESESPFPTKIAYCQYVTDRDYLCNSLMIFESLSLSGSQADLLLMYPQHWNLDPSSIEGHWLRKAREEYGVKLAPIQVQHFEGEHTWADSFTKLLAFNQTQYERVISLDSDANVLGVCSEVQEDVLALRLTHLLAYG